MLRKLLVLTVLALPVTAIGAGINEDLSPDPVLEEIVVSGYRLTSPLELDASLSLFDQETIRLATAEHS